MDKTVLTPDDRKAAAVAGNQRGTYERTPFGRRRIESKYALWKMPKFLLGLLVTSAIFVGRRFGFAKLERPGLRQ